MSNDILRFEFATLTEFVAPNGARYLRGAIDGLTLTAIPEPDREPAAGGVARWSLWASPTPGRARHVKTPAIPAPPEAASHSLARPSKRERQEAAVQDILDRYGRINDLGDPLPPALPDREREPASSEEPDLLRIPLF
jgi:hypothetical protein